MDPGVRTRSDAVGSSQTVIFAGNAVIYAGKTIIFDGQDRRSLGGPRLVLGDFDLGGRDGLLEALGRIGGVASLIGFRWRDGQIGNQCGNHNDRLVADRPGLGHGRGRSVPAGVASGIGLVLLVPSRQPIKMLGEIVP